MLRRKDKILTLKSTPFQVLKNKIHNFQYNSMNAFVSLFIY